MMPKISIIIPVFNTERYLRRCLDSVIQQTLREIEIICINDGSTDDSHTILDEYVARDSRITIISFSQNKGVSAARNAGMAVANGAYLGFVDSDDSVELQFYKKLHLKALKTDAHIVKGVRETTTIDGITAIEPLNNAIRADRFAFRYQWGTAIYRTELIREYGVTFPCNTSNSEDVAFLTKALSLVDKLEIVDDAFYHVFRRVSSLSAGALGYAKIQGALRAHEDIISFINSRPVSKEAYDRLFFIWLLMCCNILATGATNERLNIAKACATTAIKVYGRCKRGDVLDAKLADSGYGVHDFLMAGDVDGLATYLIPKTLAQRKMESLRARIKKGLL